MAARKRSPRKMKEPAVTWLCREDIQERMGLSRAHLYANGFGKSGLASRHFQHRLLYRLEDVKAWAEKMGYAFRACPPPEQEGKDEIWLFREEIQKRMGLSQGQLYARGFGESGLMGRTASNGRRQYRLEDVKAWAKKNKYPFNAAEVCDGD